jgi:hypothetical protein
MTNEEKRLKKLQYNREWYHKNKDTKVKNYLTENKDRIKNRQKTYELKNKDKIKQYRLENRSKYRELHDT